MTVETVRAFFAVHAPDIQIIETDGSTATVELAAKGHGVAPAQIAKTLSLRIKDRTLLIVTSGTTRLNNRKIKDVLGGKPRMLTADEVAVATSHPVGGVCPLACPRHCRSTAIFPSRNSMRSYQPRARSTPLCESRLTGWRN